MDLAVNETVLTCTFWTPDTDSVSEHVTFGWQSTDVVSGDAKASKEKYALAPDARPPVNATDPSLASVTVNEVPGPS